MRHPVYRRDAPKRTVSVTLNADLYARAKAAGISASRVAEEALASAYEQKCAEALAAELCQDLAAANRYVEEHGSFADLARAHYDSDDGAV